VLAVKPHKHLVRVAGKWAFFEKFLIHVKVCGLGWPIIVVRIVTDKVSLSAGHARRRAGKSLSAQRR